jgi:hypothetical protein
MLSIVNSFCSLKEYFLPLSVYLDQQHHSLLNLPIQENGRSTAALVIQALMTQSKRALHLVKHVELS